MKQISELPKWCSLMDELSGEIEERDKGEAKKERPS